MIEKHYGHLASSVTDKAFNNFAKLLNQDETQIKTTPTRAVEIKTQQL
jgi:hypothetical protein